jgi:hypothetical protein
MAQDPQPAMARGGDLMPVLAQRAPRSIRRHRVRAARHWDKPAAGGCWMRSPPGRPRRSSPARRNRLLLKALPGLMDNLTSIQTLHQRLLMEGRCHRSCV